MATSALADLLELGFDETLCILALETAGGSREVAIDLLLSGDLVAGTSELARGGDQSSAILVPRGDEKVTILELSQYRLTERSSSACTSIAWTFSAVVLESLRSGKDFENVEELTAILFEGVGLFESVRRLSSGAHLSVEEFVQLLQNDRNVKMCGMPTQCILSATNIRDFLAGVYHNHAVSIDRPVGIVITKPPESVAVVLSPASGAVAAKYYFFDSHPRPQFGIDGAYLVACDDIEGIVARLGLIFPVMEGTGDSMMDMMYNSFEGSIFQHNPSR
jgi:hypothetical protein